MSKRKILLWELIGIVIISLIGTLLHFCFEWGNFFKPLALFCAVNESVWEHLKIGFWPALLYAIIEYFAFGYKYKNFIIGKTAGLYLIPIIITILFYSYTAILGTHKLFLDIFIFYFAIAIAQIVSYKITTSFKSYNNSYNLTIIVLIIIILAFCLFTFFPPKFELFKNPIDGSFGIPTKN